MKHVQAIGLHQKIAKKRENVTDLREVFKLQNPTQAHIFS